MTISEILKIEETNAGKIYLVKEGFFGRAYEHSAYRFVKHLQKGIQSLEDKYHKSAHYLQMHISGFFYINR